MSEKPELHARLMRLHSEEELKRKSYKSTRRGYWTQENLDYSKRRAEKLIAWFSAPKVPA